MGEVAVEDKVEVLEVVVEEEEGGGGEEEVVDNIKDKMEGIMNPDFSLHGRSVRH